MSAPAPIKPAEPTYQHGGQLAGGPPLRRSFRWLFGAHGQLAVGSATFVGAVAAWVYGSGLAGEALVRFIFHASMAALVVAAYAIVATALGYRATERVEEATRQAEVARRRERRPDKAAAAGSTPALGSQGYDRRDG